MVEANVSELANSVLGFDIVHFQDIGRALNIAQNIDEFGEDAVDKKIQILRIVLAASNENKDLFWKKSHLETFLVIMSFLSQKVGKDRDYAINLKGLSDNLQKVQIQEKFQTHGEKIRKRVTRTLMAQDTLRTSSVMTHGRAIQ